jgi:uncharacterized repeat protein (TIGR03803 family)
MRCAVTVCSVVFAMAGFACGGGGTQGATGTPTPTPSQDVGVNYRVLYRFTGGVADGAGPYGSLMRSGSILYGLTYGGGSAGLGTIFKMNADGTGFEVMHSFVSATTDGQKPIGSLLQSGSDLYGMATSYGTGSGGTLFRIGADGLRFQVLHRFAENEGKWPWGTLLQSGSILYGLNTYGGDDTGSADGYGTVFRINADGTDFAVLRTFAGSGNDGGWPHGSLMQSGPALYGTTGAGTVFKINPDGSGYQLLHRFAGGSNDGSDPASTLVSAGSILCGTTIGGGVGNHGTIFRISNDGSEFALLHSFSGGNEGQTPYGSLTLVGSSLYGMTSDDGAGTSGTIFRIRTDGTGFQVLHRFGGADGARPHGSLLLSGSELLGMTSAGGSQNLGVIFALDVPQGDV